MAFAAAISAAATSVLPRPAARLNSSTPIAMFSVVSMLPRRQPRLHLSSSSTSPPLPLLHRRRRRSSSKVVYASLKGWSSVPVSDIRPSNAQESIYLITLDLSDAPILLSSYKTLGQYVLTRVASADEEKRKPAYMSICSPPRSGTLIQLLVSPIRALIKYGFAAKARDTVKLYYGASSDDLMPLRDETSGWEDTGVTVQEVIGEPVQLPFFEELSKIIVNPDSTAAILVGPKEMEEEVVGKLTDLKVPHDKILTYQGRYPGSSQ